MAGPAGKGTPQNRSWKLAALVVIVAGVALFDMLLPDSPRQKPGEGNPPPSGQIARPAKPAVLGEADFDRRIGNGVNLVDFGADWCGPCKIQEPIVAQMKTSYAGRAGVYAVDVDAFPGLASRFGITALPTLILFKDGRPVKKFIGLQNADTLADALAEAL